MHTHARGHVHACMHAYDSINAHLYTPTRWHVQDMDAYGLAFCTNNDYAGHYFDFTAPRARSQDTQDTHKDTHKDTHQDSRGGLAGADAMLGARGGPLCDGNGDECDRGGHDDGNGDDCDGHGDGGGDAGDEGKGGTLKLKRCDEFYVIKDKNKWRKRE